MRLTIVSVTYRLCSLVGRSAACLHGALGSLDCNLVIIDNASRDESAAILRREVPGQVLITNQVNVGFGRANNQAVRYPDGPYTLLLNWDAFLSRDRTSRSALRPARAMLSGENCIKWYGKVGAVPTTAQFSGK